MQEFLHKQKELELKRHLREQNLSQLVELTSKVMAGELTEDTKLIFDEKVARIECLKAKAK